MRNLHLICNAHVDPVWLWDFEEGIAAAVSTFRTAADFCEEYEGYVFNHNESLLYEWVENLEPKLFRRIQRLVKEGKWYIMGGWYLQPDCNMPSGESFIRQIEEGRNYFLEKFGVTPSTAINFDPFGHSKGLVQILKKAGFDSYLFCRPGQGDCPLPDDDFMWEGFDGSRILAHRADTYGTLMGETGKKICEWMENNRENPPKTGCFLWGVGNHGGGPSRDDMKAIEELMKKDGDGTWKLLHSTPEAYFKERKKLAENQGKQEPVVKKDLNAWAVGCYTSQIRIKQRHRELEGELAVTEKMLSQAEIRGVLSYPEKEMTDAQKALLFSEFHDILPGTSIPSAEEKSLTTLDYGLEITKKWKQKAFFRLLEGEAKAFPGEYPILIYNPHPYEIEGDFTAEFQLANQNWTSKYAMPVVKQNGKKLPCQVEKEACNLNLDWRKRISFHGKLKPSFMNRFSVTIDMLEKIPEKENKITGDAFLFDNGKLRASVNKKTGLLDFLQIDGQDYLKKGAGVLRVMKTDCDPWGMNRKSYGEEQGCFALMDVKEGSIYSGTYNERHASEGKEIESVRIVENGDVRTVVEAVFAYQKSRACVQYTFPANGDYVDINICVNWAEKGSFLKFELPTVLEQGSAFGETAYGKMEYETDGQEKVFHRYCGLCEEDAAVTVLNKGNYGADFKDGKIRISLLHSAAYSAHPIGDRPLLVQDRFLPYMEQGERYFSFRIQCGEKKRRLENVAKEAVIFQEGVMTVPAFPSGEGEKSAPLMETDNPSVILTAFRKVRGEEAYLIRLFESTGEKQKFTLSIGNIKKEMEAEPFEIKTLRYEPQKESLVPCGLFGREEAGK